MNPFSKVKPFLSRRAPTFDKLLIRCKLIGLVNRYSPLLGISPRKKRALSHSSTFSISTPTSFITIAYVSSTHSSCTLINIFLCDNGSNIPLLLKCSKSKKLSTILEVCRDEAIRQERGREAFAPMNVSNGERSDI